MKKKLFNIIKYLVGWPISIISIIFLLKFIPGLLEQILKIRALNVPILILSIVFFEIYFLLRGLIWQQILKGKGYEVSLKNLLFLWGFSELKRYVPGNIWAFLGRMVSFNSLGIKNRDVFASLLIEGEFIVLSCLLISLLSLNFLFTILPLPNFKFWLITQPLIFSLVLVVTAIFIFGSKLLKKRFMTFAPMENLRILSISVLAFLSFGIAYYFAGASLTFLNPHYFLNFAGFFVLALLIGYLSIITPMGLGVREGAIILVLSKITPLSIAAFVAFFSRILFIFSEIIFLIFSWFFYKAKNKILLRFFKLISNHKQETLLFIFILFYFVYFTTASFLRYDAFFTGRFDLGNMDQTVWNTIHGRIFQLTNPNGTDIISRLAFHADFLLILISPFYWIWNNPKMLLLIQTLVVSTGGLFVYLISKDVLKNRNISLVISIAFLLNPALEHANLYDFHPVVLATTFLLASFYFMKGRKYILMLIFLFLSGTSKENIWAIVSLFGLYLTFFERKKILGLIIFLCSILIFFILVWIVIPKAAGTQHFALSYYSDFGDSPTKIIKNIITSPIKTVSVMFQHDQLIYLLQLFQPLGFLPVLAPIFLIFSFPSLLIDLLSNNSQLHRIYYQYSASITPFLFIGTIYAVSYLRRRIRSFPLAFYSTFILISTLISAYSFGPIIGSKNPNIAMFTEDLANNNLIDRFLQRIPKRYAVAATNEVGSHISHRQKIYTLPLGLDKADVIAFYSNESFDTQAQKSNKKIINKLLNDDNYFLVYKDSQFVIFKKRGLRRSFYYF